MDMPHNTTNERRRTAQESVGTSGQRDIAGQQSDLEADARDMTADLRDRQAQARDELADRLTAISHRAHVSSLRDMIVRTALDRQRADEDRALAVEHRARAARDREHAARDRLRSARDRAAAVAEQQLAEADDLTGALRRRPGLALLRREVDRAHRTNSVLSAAFIDVDGLKAVNDTHGHRAGDTLLWDVVSALLANLRSYDLVIRVGGDEFVCALGGVTINDARTRFSAVQQTLAHTGDAISVGYAQLAANDTPSTLIERADADVPKTRRHDDDANGGRRPRRGRDVSAPPARSPAVNSDAASR